VLDRQQFLHDHGQDLLPPEAAAEDYLQRLDNSQELTEL
jgi:hypothetical protein